MLLYLKKVALSTTELTISDFLRTTRVPLANIEGVRMNFFRRGTATIYLKPSCIFGDEIVFAVRKRFFRYEPIVEELRRLIQEINAQNNTEQSPLS